MVHPSKVLANGFSRHSSKNCVKVVLAGGSVAPFVAASFVKKTHCPFSELTDRWTTAESPL